MTVPATPEASAVADIDDVTRPTDALLEVTQDVVNLYAAGVTALNGAFSVEWADRLREDIETAFEEARSRPDGAVGRGPHRLLRGDPP